MVSKWGKWKTWQNLGNMHGNRGKRNGKQWEDGLKSCVNGNACAQAEKCGRANEIGASHIGHSHGLKGMLALPFRWSFQVEVWISHITIFTIEKSLLSQWNRHSEWYLGLNTVVQTLYHRNCIISGDPPFWDKAMNRTCWGWYKKQTMTPEHRLILQTAYCTILYPESRRTIYICWSKRSLTLLQVEMMLKKCTPLWREATLHCTTLHYTTLH